jgi:hypothetical protein
MKPEISFEDWIKFDLRIGEVLKRKDDKLKILVGEKEFIINKNLKVSVGDKIVVGLQEDKIIIPRVNGSIIFIKKDIETGTKIS